ncbi:kinase-like protein [Neoconidiobolus thromboides FSU 785]|nr:kinase-like protein [Neoconidiobolus thromboides FSU 785]
MSQQNVERLLKDHAIIPLLIVIFVSVLYICLKFDIFEELIRDYIVIPFLIIVFISLLAIYYKVYMLVWNYLNKNTPTTDTIATATATTTPTTLPDQNLALKLKQNSTITNRWEEVFPITKNTQRQVESYNPTTTNIQTTEPWLKDGLYNQDSAFNSFRNRFIKDKRKNLHNKKPSLDMNDTQLLYKHLKGGIREEQIENKGFSEPKGYMNGNSLQTNYFQGRGTGFKDGNQDDLFNRDKYELNRLDKDRNDYIFNTNKYELRNFNKDDNKNNVFNLANKYDTIDFNKGKDEDIFNLNKFGTDRFSNKEEVLRGTNNYPFINNNINQNYNKEEIIRDMNTYPFINNNTNNNLNYSKDLNYININRFYFYSLEQLIVSEEDLISTNKTSISQVYKAKIKENQQKIAIKVINKQHLNQQSLDNIKNECKIHSKLSHEHIIQFYNYFLYQENIIIVLEYAPYRSLDYQLKKATIPEPKTSNLVQQLLLALQYIHSKGIVHRNIKPSNLLIDNNKDIKLSDFNQAVELDSKNLAHGLCGTTLYTAPEVIADINYTANIDIWSLAIVAHEMLTGYTPFELPVTTNRSVIYNRIVNYKPIISKDISNFASGFITSALIPDPSARPDASYLLQHPWILQFKNKS